MPLTMQKYKIYLKRVFREPLTQALEGPLNLDFFFFNYES